MSGLKASTVLQSAQSKLRPVKFDPRKKEHLKAFAMLHYGGKQHPELRFQVEQPYLDVRSMMIDRVITRTLGKIKDEVVPAKAEA